MQLIRNMCVSIVLAIATQGASANENQWQFKVFLDDKAIGEHAFTVRQQGNQEIIETNAQFDVKVLFFNAFSYRHENTEIWQDGCLKKIEAATQINGKALQVVGERANDRFLLEAESGQQELKACVSTFAYWDMDFLSQPELLNSQTGELAPVEVRTLGTEAYTWGDQTVDANAYELVVDERPIKLWYDRAGRWLGLETEVAGGRALRYEPVAIPAVAQNFGD
jgi:hypothetical protein